MDTTILYLPLTKRRVLRQTILLGSIVLMTLGLASVARAVPGDLDLLFSSDGKLTTNVGVAPAGAGAVAIQADGKILVAGGAGGDFAVARYNTLGGLDSTFAGDGIANTDLGGQIDFARAIAIQADGRIVVAGTTGVALDPEFAIVRYNSNGTLDTAFSGDGKLTMEFGTTAGGGGSANALAIQSDGKIVVVGSDGADFAIARFNTDGTLDTTFGPADTGIITRNLGGSDTATGVAIQADGRIVVAGTTSGRFAAERFNTDGFPEFLGNGIPNGAQGTSFGGGTSASATALALQADEKIVVVGEVLGGVPNRAMGVVRYNTNGSLDTTFSTSGLRGIAFSAESRAEAVAIEVDGKIVVAGRVDGVPTSNTNFAVARLNGNGSLDTTFSGDGLLVTDFSAGSVTSADFGAAVALQKKDGRIVVAGSVGSSFGVARYHAFACNGANVTLIGTEGPDTIFGEFLIVTIVPPSRIEFADVINGFGGNDTIDAGGGKDIVCGGDGSDTLIGGAGDDVLIGGAVGLDSMDGGPGKKDTCVGSQLNVLDRPDTFTSCETVNAGFSGISGEWLSVGHRCNEAGGTPSCTLRLTLRVLNPGTEATRVPTSVAFYVSADGVLDEGDTFVTAKQVRTFAAGEDRVLRLNGKVAGVSDLSGMVVIAVLDYLDNVPERNEDNNVIVSAPIG